MSHYTNIIHQLAVDSIHNIEYGGNPFSITITFEDGRKILEQFNGPLRLFLTNLKFIRSKLVTNSRDIECAISTPLHYFALLGYRKGQVWQFCLDEDAQLIIQFSC